ncbi:methionine--tRNA ligase [Sulfuracidifex metallicus]|uniref:Methionine--tRNA ligase n=1 Tax=Sulfuracidifex metallicus DSM 6482 = JCM 9184 TaxID=523847 RepID=A0A6A9QK44_SULME|nr:methionine--tRNA ligase [Sulfuracidifex metallicus]MUN28108.1 methionine--tRNA ligase [Sulfuracidifex metallicus DSM 6482 = JCM 9184]WOE51350.1 methionine--tRNA ligase [Sulfuracidifex metallicus DSM 6482 = JCM 9184]
MKVFVASAWPYVNAVPHLGNLIGSVLSADVFARYARMKYGNENVVLVSGSDEHGTPIEVEAIKRKVRPKELTDQAHEYDKRLFMDVWEISYDNYTRTESDVHKDFVKKFLLSIQSYIITQKEVLPYCENDKIFLPDRFVKGKCPYCGFEDARGDQCDNCGRLLTPDLLIEPKCSICGSKPVMKETMHWFFNLGEFNDKLSKWISESKTMPENVRAVAMSWINEGLKPRAITRDNSWGIPAPFHGAENKTVYVWFEALLGYISATIEYFKSDAWKEFWFGKDIKSYYFIGKDNIPFHAVILPAMLMAAGEYHLPDVVGSTEYLLYEGQKFSKSRKIGIWIDEAESIMDIEYWRYVLIRIRPEEKDSNFTWREVIRIVNTELNDDIGNLINRVITMINRYFNGEIPQLHHELLDDKDMALISLMKEAPVKMGDLFEKGKLKAGTDEILQLARENNAYLNLKAPWDLIKTDVSKVANVLSISAGVTYTLSFMLSPLMPKHSRKIMDLINVNVDKWEPLQDPSILKGKKVSKAEPIFSKLPADIEKKIPDILKQVREEVEKKRPVLLK